MKENYEYDFVRFKLKGGAFTGKFGEDYQLTIQDRARDGWRFVQCFAPAVVGHGAAYYVDLIFEKKVSE